MAGDDEPSPERERRTRPKPKPRPEPAPEVEEVHVAPRQQVSVSGSGHLVGTVLDSLRGQPVIIGILVLNMVFVAASHFATENRVEATKQLIMQLIDRCAPKGG